ncbi:orotate phosphoribosyltransferase [Lysobacter cavernae]|uniref:Orotate phosphoribosyltransferase n=1 Tax=Lysobacter cavernae TaxID=1685901 RepID=A0ABV7RSP2_9GAMM
MTDHRTRFLQLALRADALRFGDFTLKSGRQSPYFFNAGRFDSGAALAELAGCYADAVDAHGVAFDLLFGPAYKGIPLATALACEYARRGRDLPLAFNRKEAKAHGEGGSLIGAPLAGRRVLIVDDVITAGTAIREALAIIADAGGSAAGIVIALDRQEAAGGDGAPATTRRSAAQTVASDHGLPVIAVATLADLLAFTGDSAALADQRERLLAYRAAYGSDASA